MILNEKKNPSVLKYSKVQGFSAWNKVQTIQIGLDLLKKKEDCYKLLKMAALTLINHTVISYNGIIR